MMSDKCSQHRGKNTIPAIEFIGVSKTFPRGNVQAIVDLSLVIGMGEFIAVVGSSGSGKTTLLNLMGGIDLPDHGEISLFGRRPKTAAEWARIRAEKIGFVFQSFHLLPTLSALENVEIPMFGRVIGSSRRKRQALTLLDRVGLHSRAEHMPAELSGGEQQRVAIARSLANSPSILLADEPTGNLDSITAQGIIDLFHTIHRQDKTTIVLITHEREIAARADRILSLRDGILLSDTRTGGCISPP